jgi:hypothetical protein
MFGQRLYRPARHCPQVRSVVGVGPAHPNGADPDDDLPRTGLGNGTLLDDDVPRFA